jgi:hypothetical protein
MRSLRRFPFGSAPSRPRVELTGPLPPPQKQVTALLVDFTPAARPLPFREPAPVPAPLPLSPLVPPLPPRALTRRRWRVSRRTAAVLVLLAIDLAAFAVIVATCKR